MNTYKIRRIHIENFKSITLFDECFQENMVILDGPNGFGKTTIFDALELVMYGQIKRIADYKIVDQRQGYRDHLYRNNSLRQLLIQVQFYSDSDSFVVSKRLPPNPKNRRKPVMDNSPTAWDAFETYITPDFVSEFNPSEKVTQAAVHELLGVQQLIRAFHLFYYIQQEEKTFFLRSTESDRLNALSYLFDTKREETDRNTLDKLRRKTVKQLTILNKKIPSLQQEISQKKTALTNQTEHVLPYVTFLAKEPLPPWDKELETVTEDLRQKSQLELAQIRDFVLHVDTFEAARFNKELSAYLENKELLKHTIVLYSHLGINPTELRTISARQAEYKDWLNRLTREKFIDELETEGSLSTLINLINQHQWPVNIQETQAWIHTIRSQRKNTAELTAIAGNINKTRKTLQSLNQQFLGKATDESTGECPMCGQDWGDLATLTQQLERKQQLFERFYTDASRVTLQLEDDLFVQHITVIRTRLESYLNQPLNKVDEAFYLQWDQSDKFRPQVEAFLGWCAKHGYNLLPYVNQSMSEIEKHQMITLVKRLQEYLRSKNLTIDAKYNEASEKFTIFEALLRNPFKNDIDQVKRLSVETIDQKIAYIESIYYRSNAVEIAKLTGSLQSYEREQMSLSRVNEDITTIINTYDKSIREHWATIIRDIEVIFYLYFGKLTQYYQRGLGMFIQLQHPSAEDPGIAKALRFVYRSDSDQDAINYLSSGQLSALVIALTLALNRVYNRGLGVLLIDDPVQTMDDINMASLVELLRNDFCDMQIILSTHEEQVARYLKYKYLKYALSAERLNMKDLSLDLRRSENINE